MAVYWKRQYHGKGGKGGWYILAILDKLGQALKFCRFRWDIESMFKDCKSGGYNLEQAKVPNAQFLALVLVLVIAYSLVTCAGQYFKYTGVDAYVAQLKEAERQYPRHSEFGMGLYDYAWCYGMQLWTQSAWRLMALKPQKRRFFQRGLDALETVTSAL